MKRNLAQLSNTVYDLLVAGGGIYGAFVAWDAALRGLRVALVEKADFGTATSANSLKIIHGGLRYLQHADFRRMRESICERRTLMRIAPHLIHPLPFLIPTYGHGMLGKELLFLALLINDLVGFDRNQSDDPQKHIPRGRVISKKEVMEWAPGLSPNGLTGGVVYYDAQLYSSERFLLSILQSAAQKGADLANYVEVAGFLEEKDRIVGVSAKDRLTGDRFDIRSRTVVNACGPWVGSILKFLNRLGPNREVLWAKAFNIMTRSLFQTCAIGVTDKDLYQDRDSVVHKGTRFFFITPWHGYSLIGTAYEPFDGEPDDFKVNDFDLEKFLNKINRACPSADLKMQDVLAIQGGLIPSSGIRHETGDVQLAKQYRIYDHREDGVDGLLSVVGVKYTTARHVAEKVVDRASELLRVKPSKSLSASTPVYGGQIDRFEDFLNVETRKLACIMDEKITRDLIYNYGSAYPEVLEHLHPPGGQRAPAGPLDVLRAKTVYAVRHEMAQKLSDVMLRRTEYGSPDLPGNEVLRICADVMSQELGWSFARTQQELHEVGDLFAFRQ